MDESGGGTRTGPECVALHAWHWASAHSHAETGAPGVLLDQWPQSPSVRVGLWAVDASDCCHSDQAEVWRTHGRHRSRGIAGQTGADTAKASATRLPA